VPARTLHLRDWPFGAVGRRLLLQTLLLEASPEQGWSKRELEERVSVRPGGLDEVLAGAFHLRLIELRGRRWYAPEQAPQIASSLEAVVRASVALPDAPIPPLPARRYQRQT
jgi:hypothetical protein